MNCFAIVVDKTIKIIETEKTKENWVEKDVKTFKKKKIEVTLSSLK